MDKWWLNGLRSEELSKIELEGIENEPLVFL
jgi:hypothetical protein